MTLVLACECGARVRAPNAQPGRVGRCPACGARLRVPDPLPGAGAGDEVVVLASIPSPAAAAPSPRPTGGARQAVPAQGPGDGLMPDRATGSAMSAEVVPKRAPVGIASRGAPSEAHPRKARGVGSAGRPRERSTTEAGPGGLIRAPSRPEARLRESLLYPLWDGPALSLLVFLPPVCAVLSVFSFGLRPYLTSGDEVTTMGALTMAVPMLCMLAVVFGYAGLFLADVLETSACGEVRHPRVPGWEFFEVLGSLFRWAGACGFGVAVGAGMALAYGSASGALSAPVMRPVDELIMAALLGLGAGLWPVPVVSVMLYADLRAANPITVVGAILRSLDGSLRIGLLFAVSGAATMALADLLFSLPALGLLPTLLGIPLFWALFWYVAIVLVRRLGLFYRRHARALGWFPDRPRWGAS